MIIATHSPTALLRHASTVHLVHLDQGETHIRLLDMKDGDDVRATLQRLGASASDFFGAEAVIWVEGRTEQSALPLVMAHFSREFPELARSALVAAVPSPDTIDRASKERTIRHLLQLYERVSGGHALLPPALAFLLDREQRSPERQLELAKCRAGSFAFTERRMFENYLIVPRAVCSIMVEEARLWNVEGFALDEASVNSQLEAADLLNGHGANLLSGVFSAHQLKYDKVRHGTQLVRWLLENDPLKLRGLAEQLDCCIRGVAPLPKIAR